MSRDKQQVSTQRIALRWLLVACMAAFIFYMSSRTNADLGSGFISQIKTFINSFVYRTFGIPGDSASVIAHFCEYLIFGALLINAFRSHMSLPRALFLAIICASLYGVTDEYHQLFVEGRYCDLMDWVVDTLGGSLGALLVFLITISNSNKKVSQ